VPRLSIAGERADLFHLCEEFGRPAGVSVFASPSIVGWVTLDLREVPWHTIVEVLARLGRCDVAGSGPDTVLLTQRPTGDYRAVAAPAGAWFRLLGAVGDVAVDTSEVTGTIDCDLQGALLPEDVLAGTASAAGAHLTRRRSPAGEVLVLRGGTPALPAGLPSAPPPSHPAAMDEAASAGPALAAAIEGGLDALPRMAAAHDAGGIAAGVDDVLACVQKGGRPALAVARRRLAALRAALTKVGAPEVEGVVGARLDAFEGRLLLEDMRVAADTGDVASARAGLDRASELAEGMADAKETYEAGLTLYAQARALRDRAERALPLARLPLPATATVVLEVGGAAAIVGGRVIREGDEVVPHVRLVEVRPGRVHLRGLGGELWRPLER
jgi:hypothetical protein